MINNKLLNPRSIAVIGGSDDVPKPEGRFLKIFSGVTLRERFMLSTLKL